MKLSELLALRGEQVVVDMIPGSEITEIQGKLLVASPSEGIVLETKIGSLIIPMVEIEDISKAVPVGKIVRRWLRWIPVSQAKQHLLDRHGFAWDMAKAMSPQACHAFHEKIDHSNLGHRHRPKTEKED